MGNHTQTNIFVTSLATETMTPSDGLKTFKGPNLGYVFLLQFNHSTNSSRQRTPHEMDNSHISYHLPIPLKIHQHSVYYILEVNNVDVPRYSNFLPESSTLLKEWISGHWKQARWGRIASRCAGSGNVRTGKARSRTMICRLRDSATGASRKKKAVGRAHRSATFPKLLGL